MLSSQLRFSVSKSKKCTNGQVGSVLAQQKHFVPSKRFSKVDSREASKLAKGGVGGGQKKDFWRVAKNTKPGDTLRTSERSPWCLLPIVYPHENKTNSRLCSVGHVHTIPGVYTAGDTLQITYVSYVGHSYPHPELL